MHFRRTSASGSARAIALNYLFHSGARTEHLDLLGFYASRRAGLGARYLETFEMVMQRVCRAPKQFPIEQARGIRRCRVAGFPYNVLYREREGLMRCSQLQDTGSGPATGYREFDWFFTLCI